jgi:hypothetical protein
MLIQVLVVDLTHPDSREVYDQAISEGPALSLVVFGGQSWSGVDGQLRNEMW